MTDPVITNPSGGEDQGASLSLGGLEGLLGFHLRMAQVAIYRDFRASLAHLDLTQKQYATLELIRANDGVSQVDLAALLGADRATMMAMVDRLETRGLVRRRRSESDRRRQNLAVTDLGLKVLAEAKAAIAEHEARFTGLFGDGELATILTALRQIHERQ